MANPQAGCKRSNRRLDIRRNALDREHQLILPWFNARRSCCPVTEIQVVVNILAEVRQRPVVRVPDKPLLS